MQEKERLQAEEIPDKLPSSTGVVNAPAGSDEDDEGKVDDKEEKAKKKKKDKKKEKEKNEKERKDGDKKDGKKKNKVNFCT